jgi:hypothetical protein
MGIRDAGLVPMFLSIDVEPDAFQIRGAPSDWAGFDAMVPFLEALRTALEARSGRPASFGWYLRTDPQIAAVFGGGDYLFREHKDRLAWLASRGDYFGVHAHQLRWSEAHGTWVHDFDDPTWLTNSVRSALEAFARGAGERPRRFRCGAGFLTNEIFDVLDECGVDLELALEPVAGWGLWSREVPSGVDASPMVGAYTDLSGTPRVPYRPARHDFRVRAASDGRNVLAVPVTTVTVRPSPDAAPEVRVLYPALVYPDLMDASAASFWDLVATEITTMDKPYVSLGIRTDAADVAHAARVRQVFEALAEHPIADRLHLVDPLRVADRLV